jgi:hypothetical protein
MLKVVSAVVVVLLAALLMLDALTASAQSWMNPSTAFRVEWEPGTSRRGAVVRGYVYNDQGYTAANIRLVVESLDPAGQLAATTIGYVGQVAPPFGRAYFEVPLAAPATGYRVRVAAWEPIHRGGM